MIFSSIGQKTFAQLYRVRVRNRVRRSKTVKVRLLAFTVLVVIASSAAVVL